MDSHAVVICLYNSNLSSLMESGPLTSVIDRKSKQLSNVDENLNDYVRTGSTETNHQPTNHQETSNNDL